MRNNVHHSQEVDCTSLLYGYDDVPPPSIIHAYRSNRQSQNSRNLDDVTEVWDLSNLNTAISRPIIHVQEPTDAVCPVPVSKRHTTPLRGTSNSSSPSSLVERPDSLLARVFLPGSPVVSSIELGSVRSASSQSFRDPGTQTRTAKLRLLTNSSVVVTPGDDSSRAFVGFPTHVQIPAEHISDHSRNVDPGSQSLLLLSSSVEPDLVPPPISPKSHESHGWPDDRPSQSSHRRESASHLCSHPSSRLSSMPSSGPNPNHLAPPAIECSNDFVNVMDHYRAGDNVHPVQTSRELTARFNVPVQPYSATEPRSPSHNHPRFNTVSPLYQAAEIYQLPAIVADPDLRPPDLLRARYHRPPAGTRNLRRMSAPMGISPQFITMPLVPQSRNGLRFCHSMDSANTPQLTVPAPLAPPPPSSHSKSSRDTHHVYHPGRRPSNLTPLAS